MKGFIDRVDISLLTVRRQDILHSLYNNQLTLSGIAEQVEEPPSLVYDNIQVLRAIKLILKDDNKVYSLTEKGNNLVRKLREINR
jgi:predicted transcriptional regulator